MEYFEPKGYGRFDPAAFGLWVNVDAVLAHPKYLELGPLMWSTFHFGPGDEHRNYVQQARSEEDAIFAATCFTVATHERRHFHDLLATPYGSMLARQYLRAAFFNGFLNEDFIFRREKIAVPLEEWCQNAELFQASYGIEPPSKNIREISSIFRTMQEKLLAFDHGQINEERSPNIPTATSILEGIAVMVQLRQIGEEFGLEYGGAFGKSVHQSNGGDRYFGALGLISRMLEVRLPIALEALILQASLYGNFQDPDLSRVRYPIDVLASLLSWLRDRRIFTSGKLPPGFDGLHFVVDAVNEYFVAKHGGTLEDMVRKATTANRGVVDVLRQDLADYRKSSSSDNPYCECVLKVFDDFNSVQEPFSLRVVQNLPWYVSYDYVRDWLSCPSPLMYIDSRRGIPVTSQLSQWYYIQSEDRLYLSPQTQASLRDDPTFHASILELGQTVDELELNRKLDLETITNATKLAQDVAPAEPGTIVMRNAYVLSPRSPSKERIAGTELDLSLWQRFYDQTCPMRLFLEGPDQGMPAVAVRDCLSAYHAFHTEVYTSSGRLDGKAPDSRELGNLGSNILSTLGELKRKRGQDGA